MIRNVFGQPPTRSSHVLVRTSGQGWGLKLIIPDERTRTSRWGGGSETENIRICQRLRGLVDVRRQAHLIRNVFGQPLTRSSHVLIRTSCQVGG